MPAEQIRLLAVLMQSVDPAVLLWNQLVTLIVGLSVALTSSTSTCVTEKEWDANIGHQPMLADVHALEQFLVRMNCDLHRMRSGALAAGWGYM